MNILIKNGKIYDGTGRAAFWADVAIEKDIISKIGDLKDAEAEIVIDAAGKAVSPGFIDTHSHSDVVLLEEPFMPPKIRQGITTELLGQDGISMAPLPSRYVDTWRKCLAGLDGETDVIDWTYETTEGYLSLLSERGVGLNVGYLLPHGNLRMEAMGLARREPSAGELEAMQHIIRREMDSGALGLSTGLIYSPCTYGDTSELIALCTTVAEKGGVFVVHQRSEADAILSSMEELLLIGRESGVPLHISHMKICGKKNRDKLGPLLDMLDGAAAEGIRISFDQYPYVSGSTMLGVILPPWAHDGGTEVLLGRLKDRDARRRMVEDIQNGIEGHDNFVEFAGLEGIFITSVKNEASERFIGKNLVQLGEMTGKDPYEAMLDLLLCEENAVGMVDFYGTEEHIIEFLQRPEQNVCTDGIWAGKPHPRVYGAFPRVISEYVRKRPVLTLEDAIRKMTSKPADVFGLKGRGVLEKGAFADIVIFNPDTIADRGTYEDPHQYPDGIDYVIINGKIAVEGDVQNRIKAGRVIGVC